MSLFLPPSFPLSFSPPTPSLSPCASFQSGRVCQVPDPGAGRSKADKGTGDLLFYSGIAQNGIPYRLGHRIPSFIPFASFTHSTLYCFSIFFVTLPHPSLRIVCKLKHMWGCGIRRGGFWELTSHFVRVVGIVLVNWTHRVRRWESGKHLFKTKRPTRPSAKTTQKLALDTMTTNYLHIHGLKTQQCSPHNDNYLHISLQIAHNILHSSLLKYTNPHIQLVKLHPLTRTQTMADTNSPGHTTKLPIHSRHKAWEKERNDPMNSQPKPKNATR